MLDEFPALGKLEFFETALGFLAGYGIKAVLVSQSISQLRKTYRQNSSLLDNCHVRAFYAPNMIESGECVSKMLGTTTIEYSWSGVSRPFGALLRGASYATVHWKRCTANL